MKLVVYFSRKGRVRAYAQARAREAGADIAELRTGERTRGILGFWWCGRFAMHRWPMALAPLEIQLEDYAQVILCSPVWAFSACAPVWAFARLARGRVKNVEYALVHFSFAPMRYRRTVAALDAALGVCHQAYESVACAWGHVFRKRRYTRAS